LAATFASKPRAEWLALLEPLDACVGPVADLGEAYHDAQLLARGMVVPPGAEHPWPGIGNPVLLRSSLAPLPKPAPLPRAPGLGEHTDAVLRDAGYDASEIEGLRARGVV
jgi:alpha-methylacyl-CoA racemase